VTALLAAGPEIQVSAVCGRNEALLEQLMARGEPDSRLRVISWTTACPGG
jgi:hypothetical protein